MGVFIRQRKDSNIDVCNITRLRSLANDVNIKIIQVFILNDNYFLVEYTKVYY
jgi:hypothetical protein